MADRKIKWACMFLIVVSIVSVVYTIFEDGPTQAQAPQELMITAAHIPAEEFPDYTLVHVNEKLDKAYYLYNKYKPIKQEVGTRVEFGEGLLGTIKETMDFAFLVEVDNPDAIVRGLSGSRVKAKGKYIGVVSALVEGGLVKCIYY